jgi:ABC-type lipoprotein release transport system permease subunit
VVGLAIAAAVSRTIQGLLYEVRPHDPSTLIGVVTLLLAVVVVACAIPARRAAAVPPAQALRMEGG